MAIKTSAVFFVKPFCPILFGPLRLQCLTTIVIRQCSQATEERKASKPKKYEFVPTADSTNDWIGPPDRLSNLRPVIYHVPKNETELEKRLRCLRQETDDWNRKFWTRQNVTFSKEKDEFVLAQLRAKGLSERDETGRKINLNSEEMAVFYKQFLDTNRKRHSDYNIEWYRRNFAITVLMSRVAIISAWTRLSKRMSGGKNGTSTTDTQ